MSLFIDQAIWDKLPGMRIVVVAATGLDNRRPRPRLDKTLADTEQVLRATWGYPNAQSHPRVAAWREAFKQRLEISVKRHQSSIEALCRRALSRGLPRINPLVDFYNWISLRFVVPAGGWDVAELGNGRVRLALTAGGEPFRELGRDETVAVGPGEVAYSDGDEVITRHFVWRQSEKAKVSPETTELFLVSEILPAAGRELAGEVKAALAGGLRDVFGVAARTAILEAPASVWDWR